MLCAVKKQREDWLEHRPSTFDTQATKKSWSSLWNVKIPSKVRIFVWRLAHTSIPTGALKHERKMAVSPVCSICNDALDTWRHSLMNCRMARCVWALGDEGTLEHVISNQTDDAKMWIFWLFDTMKEEELARVLITMWAIWWARWRAIHDNQFQSPLTTMGFINNYLEELQIASNKKSVTSVPQAMK